MDVKEMKTVVQEELEGLKEKMAGKKEFTDLQEKVNNLLASIEDDNTADEIKKLTDSLHQMNEKYEKLKAQKETRKTIADQFAEKSELFEKLAKGDEKSVRLNVKVGTAASITDDTEAMLTPGIGQKERGRLFMRDLFNIRPVSNNSHGSIRWYEQETITNNEEQVAQGSAASSESTATWVEKTLDGKRLNGWSKIHKDQLKDTAFMEGELRSILRKNIGLKEQTDLTNGTGAGNAMYGILPKSTAFDATSALKFANANIFDLIGSMITQVQENSKDGKMPNYIVMHPRRVRQLRNMKDADGRYLNPAWANTDVQAAIDGAVIVSNSLFDYNTILVGDFSFGDLFVWDDLEVEIGMIGDDFIEGKLTMNAYIRENLRIKDVDTNGFIKVTDIDAEISAITEVTS